MAFLCSCLKTFRNSSNHFSTSHEVFDQRKLKEKNTLHRFGDAKRGKSWSNIGVVTFLYVSCRSAFAENNAACGPCRANGAAAGSRSQGRSVPPVAAPPYGSLPYVTRRTYHIDPHTLIVPSSPCRTLSGHFVTAPPFTPPPSAHFASKTKTPFPISHTRAFHLHVRVTNVIEI